MILLTVQEVANVLKLSVLTIYKYIKEQKLEAVSFGGHYRIPETALDSFIQSHLVAKSNSSNPSQNPQISIEKPIKTPFEELIK